MQLNDAFLRDRLPVGQIDSVTFYKRDEVTTDLICCDVEVAGECWSFHEEMEGWDLLTKHLEQLPGFRRDWYAAVVKPPFAEPDGRFHARFMNPRIRLSLTCALGLAACGGVVSWETVCGCVPATVGLAQDLRVDTSTEFTPDFLKRIVDARLAEQRKPVDLESIRTLGVAFDRSCHELRNFAFVARSGCGRTTR